MQVKGTDRVYAYTNIARKTVYLHRFITYAPKGFDVDHINHDTLDCQDENLRICTRSQNLANSRKRMGGTSRHKGVYFHSRSGRWVVRVHRDGKMVFSGVRDDEDEAGQLFNVESEKVHGSYHIPNAIR